MHNWSKTQTQAMPIAPPTTSWPYLLFAYAVAVVAQKKLAEKHRENRTRVKLAQAAR